MSVKYYLLTYKNCVINGVRHLYDLLVNFDNCELKEEQDKEQTFGIYIKIK